MTSQSGEGDRRTISMVDALFVTDMTPATVPIQTLAGLLETTAPVLVAVAARGVSPARGPTAEVLATWAAPPDIWGWTVGLLDANIAKLGGAHYSEYTHYRDRARRVGGAVDR